MLSKHIAKQIAAYRGMLINEYSPAPESSALAGKEIQVSRDVRFPTCPDSWQQALSETERAARVEDRFVERL